MLNGLAADLRADARTLLDPSAMSILQQYIGAADKLAKAKAEILRFWRVTDDCGSGKAQTLYLIKRDKTPRGHKVIENL